MSSKKPPLAAEEIQNDTLSSLFPAGQFRMRELNIYNWGGFSGFHGATIDPNGTLVTGHTGAGKSTFVDAQQVLFLASGSIRFNLAAAQDDTKDRSLLSYIRGQTGSEADSSGRTVGQFKRKGTTASGIRALFVSERGDQVTLAALFWITADGHSSADIKKDYFVLPGDVSLKRLITALVGAEGRPSRKTLEAAFDDIEGVFCSEHFSEYEPRYQKALNIENSKAPLLMSRAMGLKRINDLTELVRTLVLEEPRARIEAQEVISEFTELKAIHSELLDAERREEILRPLPGLLATIEDQEKLIFRKKQLLRALPVHFARQCVRLLEILLLDGKAQKAKFKAQVEALKIEIQQVEAEYNTATEAFLSAGGGDLQSRRDTEALLLRLFNDVERSRNSVERALDFLGMPRPDEFWGIEQFVEAQGLVSIKQQNSKEELSQIDVQYDKAIIARNDSAVRRDGLKHEIAALKRTKDSLIDRDYQIARAQICEELGLTPAELPFIGEMIDVKPEEIAWKGAIERAMGFDRLVMLVGRSHREDVAKCISNRHWGMKIGYEVAEEDVGRTSFAPKRFVTKLVWRDHKFKAWLMRWLSEKSLTCVDSIADLNTTPYSMTIQGLIHRAPGSFVKDDRRAIDDPKGWLIGFSNQNKIEALEAQAQKLDSEYQVHDEAQRKATEAKGQIALRARAIRVVLDSTWNAIDIKTSRADLTRAQQAVSEIEMRSGDLHSADEKRKAASKALNGLRESSTEASNDHAVCIRDLALLDTKLRGYQQTASALEPEDVLAELQLTINPLQVDELSVAGDRENKAANRIRGDQSDAEKKSGEAFNEFQRHVTKYATTFPTHSANLSSVIRRDQSGQLTEWVSHYNDVVTTGLHTLKDRFTERLRTHSTQKITKLHATLDDQRVQIVERIEEINQVLRITDYKDGVFLELVAEPLNLESVKSFDKQLLSVLQLTASEQSEAHFAALERFIETLTVATNSATKNTKENLPKLDYRFRLSFAARTIQRSDNRVTDYMPDTGGKSGGEKESISGFIVAASLAYVLTPMGGLIPSYGTVWLDEAFANTSLAVARRVMNVFKSLHLHVNLITPFKNVELARKHLSSAIIVSADDDFNSGILPITWAEIDAMLIRQDPMTEAHARLLGVDVQAVSQA